MYGFDRVGDLYFTYINENYLNSPYYVYMGFF